MKTLQKILDLFAKFKDHADSLNRRAEVENVLWSVAAGKRHPLTKTECRELALKLGVPSSHRKETEKR